MKHLFMLVTLLAAIVAANAFTSLEIETNATNGVETFRLYTVKPVAKNLGVFAFMVVTEGWGQAYAGLDYTPIKQLDLGLGYGVDTAGDNHRIGGYAIVHEGRFAIKHFFENEGSGEFHQTFATYQATDKLTIGVDDHKFKGTGPMIDYRISKSETIRVVAFPETTCVSLFTTF